MALGARQTVTLFGRFRMAGRDDILQMLQGTGASAVKDLTRATTLFVVGSGALNLVPGGQLSKRLAQADERGIPVIGEARLISLLNDTSGPVATVPVASVQISAELRALLNAFDLIRIEDGKIPFEDVDALKNAATLEGNGLDPAATLSALRRKRTAPRGRHSLTTDGQGEAVLSWGDGMTTLTGQGLLPLDENEGLDALFETGLDAEAEGDFEAAERAYATCTGMDKRDPIAPFNLGNVQSSLTKYDEAALSYQMAIARDGRFSEAHFNLAGLLEKGGDRATAKRHLMQAVEIDPAYAEAHFNLAQLALATENWTEAKDHFAAYLRHAPHGALAQKAERALHVLAMQKL